nr:reverse transcriptase domain-containing protein [Tanacetum cinerariifolium]
FSSLGSLPSNTITNPKGDLRAITTRSGVSYDGPPIPPPFSPPPKVVEQGPERPFLRTARALVDVYDEELTLRVSDEGITFKVGNTSRYSYNDAKSINQINVIDVACEEYSQEVLGFYANLKSGNPTPTSKPIIAKSSPSLTSFEGVDEPLELELKDLPSHLEYAFLESTNKLPIIIAKKLKDKEKERLIKDNHGWYIPSKVMFESMTVHLEVRLKSARKLDHEVHSFEQSGDHPRLQGIVAMFQGPIGLVFKFDREMTSLSIHKLIRSTADGCLKHGRGVPNQAKRDIKIFTTTQGIISRERFCFNLFRQVVYCYVNVLVPLTRRERAHKVDAPYVKDLVNLNCILRHLITLRFFLNMFPNELTKLPLLEKLYLDKNKSLTLPAEVGDLKNLKVLTVDCNILVLVPVSEDILRRRARFDGFNDRYVEGDMTTIRLVAWAPRGPILNNEDWRLVADAEENFSRVSFLIVLQEQYPQRTVLLLLFLMGDV